VDYYGRQMMIVAGLRHVRDTGTLPDNRAQIDEACREVLQIAPANNTAHEWLDATKLRRRNRAAKAMKQG
jgi:hypothetical protein